MSDTISIRFVPEGSSETSGFVVTGLHVNGTVGAGDVIVEAAGRHGPTRMLSPCSGTIVDRLVTVGQPVEAGMPILTLRSPALAPDFAAIEAMMDEKIWNLAIATNAAFKGLLGHMGASGHIAASTEAVKVELPVNDGVPALVAAIAAALADRGLEDGDVVVVAEKPFAVAQRRLVPFRHIYETDPKKMSRPEREALRARLAAMVDTPVEPEDLILADTYTEDPALGEMATVGASGHNQLAHQVAAALLAATGRIVDVVISDTDTGVDIRETIIGCITLGATPLGATRGVNLYECMRAACAAEFTRGSKNRTPIVICKPAYRCRRRPDIGAFRGYDGKLRLAGEGGRIAFA